MFDPLTQASEADPSDSTDLFLVCKGCHDKTQTPESVPWESTQYRNLSVFYSRCVEILPCALDPLLIIAKDLEVSPEQVKASIADVICKHLERSDVQG